MSEATERNGVEITTNARVHFGLLDVDRPFGGCGVMIDHPQTTVQTTISNRFEIVGSDQERIKNVADSFAYEYGLTELPNVRIEVTQRAPSHCGLGSGTQLSLAIAESIACLCASDIESPLESPPDSLDNLRWLRAADRGHRSAVGTHGYFHGGMICEGIDAQLNASTINPLNHRLTMPESWRVGLLLPKHESEPTETVSGDDEQKRFDELPPVDSKTRNTMVALIRDRLVPAIERQEFWPFANALEEYNLASGELFSSVQGGPYNGPQISYLIESLRQGASKGGGVGQSSWGPGVFLWFESAERAEDFGAKHPAARLNRFMVAKPSGSGRRIRFL